MTNDTTARAEHTPTPWRAQRREKVGVAIIAERRDIPPGGTPTNGLVAYATRRFSEPKEIWEANAAFIVRACNSHEAMRDALKEAVKIMDDHRQFLADNYRIGDPKDPELGEISAEGKEEIAPWDEALETIRAALALANGAS